MRFGIAVLALLAMAPLRAGEFEVTLQTPASVAITAWCQTDEPCNQPAADHAQTICSKYGKSAQLAGTAMIVERSLFRGEKVLYRFNCVR